MTFEALTSTARVPFPFSHGLRRGYIASRRLYIRSSAWRKMPDHEVEVNRWPYVKGIFVVYQRRVHQVAGATETVQSDL